MEFEPQIRYTAHIRESLMDELINVTVKAYYNKETDYAVIKLDTDSTKFNYKIYHLSREMMNNVSPIDISNKVLHTYRKFIYNKTFSNLFRKDNHGREELEKTRTYKRRAPERIKEAIPGCNKD